MTVTITQGAATVQPFMVLGYDYSRASGNVLHTIIGSAVPSITLRPLGPRTGSLSLLCLTEADAKTIVDFHANPGTFALVDSELTSQNMSYVPMGSVRVALDPQTRTRWLVNIDFQEVT